MKTVNALKAKDDTPVMLCTGVSMEEVAAGHGLKMCDKFHPEHSSKLGNPFACYVNYASAWM